MAHQTEKVAGGKVISSAFGFCGTGIRHAGGAAHRTADHTGNSARGEKRRIKTAAQNRFLRSKTRKQCRIAHGTPDFPVDLFDLYRIHTHRRIGNVFPEMVKPFRHGTDPGTVRKKTFPEFFYRIPKRADNSDPCYNCASVHKLSVCNFCVCLFIFTLQKQNIL